MGKDFSSEYKLNVLMRKCLLILWSRHSILWCTEPSDRGLGLVFLLLLLKCHKDIISCKSPKLFENKFWILQVMIANFTWHWVSTIVMASFSYIVIVSTLHCLQIDIWHWMAKRMSSIFLLKISSPLTTEHIRKSWHNFFLSLPELEHGTIAHF